MVPVLLAVHLARVGLSEEAIGRAVAAGLGGTAAAVAFVLFLGDRLPRRPVLVGLGLLGGVGGVAVALASGAWIVAAAAFLGMVNGMGRDRGAQLALEQAMLPATTSDRGRTRAFAW